VSNAALFRVARSVALIAMLGACSQNGRTAQSGAASAPAADHEEAHRSNEEAGQPAAPPLREGQAEAIFAGGCFWCVESAFEGLPGVVSVTSGYTGGHTEHPTYREVGGHATGHLEAVRIVYDPEATSYAALLEVFWHNIDPTQGDGQFCDRGDSYLSAIFVATDDERRLASETKASAAAELDEAVVTTIRDAATFWVAEDYHQDFYRTNPGRYTQYRTSCGRDRRLRELWGDAAGH